MNIPDSGAGEPYYGGNPHPPELSAEPTEVPIADRLSFLNLGPAQAGELQRLVQRFRPHAEEFVEKFYRHLFSFHQTAAFLQEPELVERLKRAQQEHLQSLLEAEWDESYVDRRRRVGEVHAFMGVEPQWFLGAYNQYLLFWIDLLAGEAQPGKAIEQVSTNQTTPQSQANQSSFDSFRALIPAVLLDIGLTLDAYFVQLTQDMRQALSMYWKVNNELRQFAQLTSHDLKTPLATVANLCDEALDEFGSAMPAGAKELIERARQRVFRMSSTIDELLATVMLPSRREEEETIESSPVVAEVVEMLRPLLADKRIRLRVAANLPPVRADQTRLREIFLNLLSNAIKFQDKQPGSIEIAADVTRDQCIFQVRDNGSGIPADEQQRIFSPFRRLRTHLHIPGSGLGLYFTRNLAEQLGGRVWVESVEGRGSTFFLSLHKGEA